ncbi:MAG: entericidin A/B family lipoprotein [Verrucomicrobiales bacterium]|jgi:predicted small secreted protein|nr:entericidin A/B family lipoprotein [Verrucomicrobiales bacterium]
MKTLALLSIVLFFLATAMFTSSCSTAEGFGRDMQYLGRAIENAAD